MIRGFWQNIIDEKISKGKSIAVLAPMADVTDAAFRHMIALYGKPDVTWTEFVSADGLASGGRDILKRDLEYSEEERPIVAQLFTSDPDTMRKAAALCRELGFDGIDINMGCPDKSIEKQGAGAKLITTPRIAQKVIRAAQEGAIDIPVSVKTRIGFNKVEWQEWLPYLLECDIPVITIHLRTRKEMSAVPAHWEYMKEIVNFVREKTGPLSLGGTIVLGNGDVKNIQEGKKRAQETGCDGVMIGRGVFGTPWLFDEKKHEKSLEIKEKLAICIEHTELFEKKLGDIKNFAIMKKHFKAYINNFDGAKELRMLLMETKNAGQVREIIEGWLLDNRKE